MSPRPQPSRPTATNPVELAPPEPGHPGPLLTATEVAELLRVDPYTVRRWVGRDQLPAYRIGREIRIDGAALTAWLDARRTAARPA